MRLLSLHLLDDRLDKFARQGQVGNTLGCNNVTVRVDRILHRRHRLCRAYVPPIRLLTIYVTRQRAWSWRLLEPVLRLVESKAGLGLALHPSISSFFWVRRLHYFARGVVLSWIACIADADDGDCLILGHPLITRLIEVYLLVQILIEAATFLCCSPGLDFDPVGAVDADRLNLGVCHHSARLGRLLNQRGLARIRLLLDREQSRLGGIGGAALDV